MSKLDSARSWLGRAWDWFKKNWQWVILPIGATTFLLSLLANSRTPSLSPTELEELDEIERRKDMELAQAEVARDAKLRELAEAHAERLNRLTNEQERELEDLTEKPIEEVVRWFDKL